MTEKDWMKVPIYLRWVPFKHHLAGMWFGKWQKENATIYNIFLHSIRVYCVICLLLPLSCSRRFDMIIIFIYKHWTKQTDSIHRRSIDNTMRYIVQVNFFPIIATVFVNGVAYWVERASEYRKKKKKHSIEWIELSEDRYSGFGINWSCTRHRLCIYVCMCRNQNV